MYRFRRWLRPSLLERNVRFQSNNVPKQTKGKPRIASDRGAKESLSQAHRECKSGGAPNPEPPAPNAPVDAPIVSSEAVRSERQRTVVAVSIPLTGHLNLGDGTMRIARGFVQRDQARARALIARADELDRAEERDRRVGAAALKACLKDSGD